MAMPLIAALHRIRIRDFAAATYGLIFFNIAVYVWVMRGDPRNMVDAFGLVPSSPTLQTMFTASFLHRDMLHLTGNMIFLWLFGRKVEQAIGPFAFFFLYVGGGFAASVTYVAIAAAFLPPVWAGQAAVGASGPIAAVLGVFAIRFSSHRFHARRLTIPALPVLFGWLLAQITLGILGLYQDTIRLFGADFTLRDVGYWAHVGGFVFGMALAKVSRMALEGEKEHLRDDARETSRRGTLRELVLKYEAITAYDPDDAFAYAELGRTWALLEDREEAERHYSRAAQLYLRKGLGEEALKRYDELRGYFPAAGYDPETEYRLACYLEEVGHYQRSAQILEEVYRNHPESQHAEMAMLKCSQIQLNRLNLPGPAAATLSAFVDRYPHSHWIATAQDMLSKAQERVGDQIPPFPDRPRTPE